MYGADVFVLTNNAGQWTLQDRFASGFFMPNLDGTHSFDPTQGALCRTDLAA